MFCRSLFGLRKSNIRTQRDLYIFTEMDVKSQVFPQWVPGCALAGVGNAFTAACAGNLAGVPNLAGNGPT